MTKCCGQKTTKPLSERHRMKVRYLGGRPLKVIGPVTKQVYRFSGKDREQLVDPRDAVGIVRGGAFQLAGIIELGSESNSDG